jgi:alanyl-tRNA synthetase
MTGHEIRAKYLAFFASKGHKVVVSDSLVPKDDPTVLFTTAGMQQFKPQFMGHITDFTRAVSSQKCLRTDDLPEVGVTDFHHTMFEMLGNFSFGDYFKREAITWAWEFLTTVMNIPADKLWVSVNKDDDEAYAIWLNDIKVPPGRIVKLGDKSNFWPSNARLNGPNGPCGPCSEIFFDWGVNNCKNPECNPDCSCGRFCEVWNLVFTQYNRKEGGVLEPLPAKNIDTGMGLERLTAVMQGKKNNYESDLFTRIMAAVRASVAAENITISVKENRVIADHIRAVTFGLADGVVPSNEGRGYVMRRLIVDMTNILIRAGIKKPLVHTYVSAVVEEMKEAYPDLVIKAKDITVLLKRVEESVFRNISEKSPELQLKLKELSSGDNKDQAQLTQKLGALMFYYRDTCGLAMEFIAANVAACFSKELLNAALPVFEKLMSAQKERSRLGSKMQGDVFLAGDVDVKGLPKTEFIGFDVPSADTRVEAVFVGGCSVSEACEGDAAAIILNKSPFYAEQGGQVGDTGVLRGDAGMFEARDTQKQGDVFVHRGIVSKGKISKGDIVKASINGERRIAIMRNHTATHLLQAALRLVLGDHIKQQGSSVDELRLRFDFTHPKGVTRDELLRIEDSVNSFVRRCDPVVKKVMTIEEARQSGALAFFAEKYGSTVRVVAAGEYSREFCGGTHLDVTGQIGLFKILSEGAVAQGIRRIEAVTGTGALEFVRGKEVQLEKTAALLKSSTDEVALRVEQQVKRVKDLQRSVGEMNFELIKASLMDIIARADSSSGTVFIAHSFNNADMETLRRVADLVKQKCPSVAALLAAVAGDDAAVIVMLSDDLVKKGYKAGDLIAKVAPLFGGSGGGRPNMAQAGCKDPQKLNAVFAEAAKILKESVHL